VIHTGLEPVTSALSRQISSAMLRSKSNCLRLFWSHLLLPAWT